MAGLDKILEKIQKEGEANAASILAGAKEAAEKVLQAARDEAGSRTAAADAETDRMVAAAGQRYASLADTQKKQAFLSAKQEMIRGCIDKAREHLLKQDAASYFAMVEKQLKQHLSARDGILYFSPEDKARLPEGFAGKVQELAQAAGGTVTLSEETRNIEGGFVLAYGGIEENCSIGSIFEEKADELADTVQRVLFS